MASHNEMVTIDVSLAALKSLGRASDALSEHAGAYIHRHPEPEKDGVAGAYATVSSEREAPLSRGRRG